MAAKGQAKRFNWKLAVVLPKATMSSTYGSAIGRVAESDNECLSGNFDFIDSDIDGYESEDMFAKDSEIEQSGDEPDSEPEVDGDCSVEFPNRKQKVRTPPGSRMSTTVTCSSVPAKKTTSYSHLPTAKRSRSLSHTPKSVSRTCPKTLQMEVDRLTGNVESHFSSVLGEITNLLGSVIERLDKTESKLDSMERKLQTTSSSAASGSDSKRVVPTVVRVRNFQ